MENKLFTHTSYKVVKWETKLSVISPTVSSFYVSLQRGTWRGRRFGV